MSPPQTLETLDVVVTRGDAVESHHRVHAAVVQGSQLVGAVRDSGLVSHWRSCAKPFQLIPFMEAGQLDQLGWDNDEIALASASHGGEPEHVAIAERMLRAIGMEEGDLACGVQDPLSQRGARILREAGLRPTRLHNNCSGKHAAMLARAHLSGWAPEGYERAEHPVHQSIFASVEEWTGMLIRDMTLAVDGCGVVVFALPLEAMARAYSRLVIAAAEGDPVPRRIVNAMREQPFLVGGTDRFDSVLMEETDGAVLSKIGAEGIHCAVVIDSGTAIALKVEDGALRAQYPALLTALQRLGALPAELPPRLAEYMNKPIRNTRNEVVGEITIAA